MALVSGDMEGKDYKDSSGVAVSHKIVLSHHQTVNRRRHKFVGRKVVPMVDFFDSELCLLHGRVDSRLT